MADVASVRVKIKEEEVQFRSSISESTMTNMASSVNWIIDNSTYMVGDTINSCLTEPQFQAQRGTDWVLMDGRSVVGSDFETITGQSNIPDARGRYIRMQDNGAGVDPDAGALLSTQSDKTAQNGLSITGGSHTHDLHAFSSTPGGDATVQVSPGDVSFDESTVIQPDGGHTHTVSGDNETRPQTLILNTFVKINNTI